MGAREFSFDLDTGWGALEPPADSPLDLSAVDEAVRQAGFELLGVQLDLQGRLRPAGGGRDGPELELVRSGQRILLLEGGSDGQREAWSRLSTQLDREGLSLRIRGPAHEHVDGPLALTVGEFEVVGQSP